MQESSVSKQEWKIGRIKCVRADSGATFVVVLPRRRFVAAMCYLSFGSVGLGFLAVMTFLTVPAVFSKNVAYVVLLILLIAIAGSSYQILWSAIAERGAWERMTIREEQVCIEHCATLVRTSKRVVARECIRGVQVRYLFRDGSIMNASVPRIVIRLKRGRLHCFVNIPNGEAEQVVSLMRQAMLSAD